MSRLLPQVTMMIVVLAVSTVLATAQPLGTEFTYQGELRMSGEPLNDSADFRCTLWNESTGGEMVAEAQTVNNVEVIDGLFQLVLDFGAEAFDGDARWLRIAVRSPSGVGGFTTMQPRQPLTATPYSLQTRGITVNETGDRVGIGTSAPAAQLHVSEGSDAPAVILIDSGENNPQFSAIDFHDRGALTWGMGKDASNDFYVDTAVQGRRLTIDHDTGRVGIGTAAPVTMLDVRGEAGVDGIRFPDGTVQTGAATRTEEALRMIRGTVFSAGNTSRGEGFTTERTGLGQYLVTFDQPFASQVPTVVTSSFNLLGEAVVASTPSISINGFNVEVRYANDDQPVDADFNFIVMGLRN